MTLTLNLEPNYDLTSDEIPDKIKGFFQFLMKHQIDTYLSTREYPVTLNTYSTGSGKTKASFLHLLDKPKQNVLLIAPTNELISQHVRDAETFVNDTNLTHHVIELNANLLTKLTEGTGLRRGEVLYKVLENPRNELFATKLGIPEEKMDTKFPIILITNPDIFYYALSFSFNKNDKRNIFNIFFDKFEYIIIDEFHYYNPKQLCCFLFFISLSYKFGRFNQGRRITILTATPLPQVIKYFERLKKQGCNYFIVEPEEISENDKNSVRTLSPLKLIFYPLEKYQNLKDISFNLDFIERMFDENKDGAVISNSLININDFAKKLKNKGYKEKIQFGRITGMVSKEERKISSKMPLILATPTVDIGYNFDKENKARQNIDFLIFDFRYKDQFWQRIGRAGRVLGKPEKENSSETIVFVSEEQYSKLSKIFKNDTSIKRSEFKKLTDENQVFKERSDLYDYISFYGITELAKVFENLREITSPEEENEIKEELFNSVKEIFCKDSNKTYASIHSFMCKFNSLKKADKNILDTTKAIFQDFLFNSGKENINFEKITDKNIESFKQNGNFLELLKNYIKEEIYFIEGLYNFRESFPSIGVCVYDSQKEISSGSNILTYDLFHLLRYYKLKFSKSKEDFVKENKLEGLIEKADYYCNLEERITDMKLTLSFNLDTDLPIVDFNKRYLNKITSKNNFSFELNKSDKTGTISIPKSLYLDNAISELYIPCIIGDSILETNAIKNNLFPIYDLKVSDFSKKYKVLFGTNAYLLAPKLKWVTDYIDRKTAFYVC